MNTTEINTWQHNCNLEFLKEAIRAVALGDAQSAERNIDTFLYTEIHRMQERIVLPLENREREVALKVALCVLLAERKT